MSEYGQSFYDKRRSLARSSADAVVPLVLEIVAPKRVVDLGRAGCVDGAQPAGIQTGPSPQALEIVGL